MLVQLLAKWCLFKNVDIQQFYIEIYLGKNRRKQTLAQEIGKKTRKKFFFRVTLSLVGEDNTFKTWKCLNY